MKAQQFMVVLLLASFTATGSAQTLEERILTCSAEVDQMQRLACFDAVARDVASGPGESIHKDPTDNKFGLEHKEKNDNQEAELLARVSSVYKDALGKLLLILDNGQIWQQKDSKTLIIHKGDPVRIERGFMSAFYLTANDKKRISVTRIK